MSLQRAVAAPFRQKGTERLKQSEFTVALSLDLEWFSPDQAKRLADVAATEGLVEQTEAGELVVTFDPRTVEIPDGFKPGEEVLQQRSTFEKLLDTIVENGIEKRTAVADINRLQTECGISVEAAAALYALGNEIPVTDLATQAMEEL